MVVDTAGVGHGLEGSVEAFFKFVDRQVGVPGKRARSRVHRHVQDDNFAGLVGFAGKFGSVRGVGHDGSGDGAGQGQNTAITGQVLPQVINDQAQISLVRCCVMRGRRRMGGTGQAAKQGKGEREAHLSCRA